MDRDDRVLAFVQGRMTAEDRRAFENEMAADRALEVEVAAMTALRAEFAATDLPEETAEAGWARLAPALGAGSAPAAANANRAPRLSLWQTGGLIAASLALWQVVAVPLISPPPETGFRPVSTEFEAPVIQVIFTPGAEIAEISGLLTEHGGSILSGPSAIGLYHVAFDSASARDAALAAFEQRSDLVSSAHAN